MRAHAPEQKKSDATNGSGQARGRLAIEAGSEDSAGFRTTSWACKTTINRPTRQEGTVFRRDCPEAGASIAREGTLPGRPPSALLDEQHLAIGGERPRAVWHHHLECIAG